MPLKHLGLTVDLLVELILNPIPDFRTNLCATVTLHKPNSNEIPFDKNYSEMWTDELSLNPGFGQFTEFLKKCIIIAGRRMTL